MNGLDFDLRVRRPWARDPSFYATVFGERSDVPQHEGVTAAPSIDLFAYDFPLSRADQRRLSCLLDAIPPLLEQAKINLHDSDARDLWVYSVRTLRSQSEVLANLQAGRLDMRTLEGSKHASLAEVVETIIENKVVQHAVTIAEGLTSEQIVAKLLETDALAGQIKEIPREGTLLPETYKFTRGMARDQIIQRMSQAHKLLLQEVWEHRTPDIPIKTPEQLVTLASIVEKETGKPEERSRVASVFINRLKSKMRLQSDPTIIYGLTGGKGSLGRPIMKSEIEQHTPYNTYVIDGLPPGPIANPGRASLEAAANPARTKDLYFVADGTGGHVFSENYEQHQKNVARLRGIERGDTPAPPTAKP